MIQTEREMDASDGEKNKQTKKQTNEQMNKWTNEQTNKQINEQINKQINKQTNKQTNKKQTYLVGCVLAIISSISRDEVLDASMQDGLHTISSCENTACLTLRSS